MTDDPYLAAAEAYRELKDVRSTEPVFIPAATIAAIRAAVDAARQPLLDENQQLRDRIAELEAERRRPPMLGPMEPLYPCRRMPTRHCPAEYGGVCGERPCARYESQDETPWLPEALAWHTNRTKPEAP